MNKLLFFATDYGIGTGCLMADQLSSIFKEKIEVVGISSGKEQEPGLLDSLKNQGINVDIIDDFDTHHNIKDKVKELRKIIRKEKIKVVHVQNNWQLILISLVKFLYLKKINVIYTLHGFRNNNPIKSKIAQILIGAELFLLADKVICMTDYLRKKFRFVGYKIIKLPLGIKDSYFINEYVPPENNYLNIIFPAQFRKGKNQDLIIRSFGNYLKVTQDKNSQLILPGTGPLLDEMQELVKTMGLEKQILFPGFVSKEEIKKLYLSSNIAVVASNSETFGQSIVEPFVLGRCVITTPVGIAPEIIRNGYNGYIFNNEQELTEIFLKLSKDSDILVSIGKNNFSERNQFRWEIITKKYKEKINETTI